MKSVKDWAMYYGVLALRNVLNVMNVLPIKKNRIVFYSFNGKNCGCNPYYICSALAERDGGKYEMIWGLKDPENLGDTVPAGCKVVKFRSPKWYYYIKTARVVVLNVQEEGEVARRKGQLFMQTWHASNGYKKVSYPKNALEKKKMKLSHKNYSLVFAGCKSMEERRVRNSMGFSGKVIPGTPRMDVLVNHDRPDYRKKVLDTYGLPEDAKILLYAPTWKKDRSDSEYGLDYDAVKSALEKKFGGNWTLLVRFHPNMKVSGDFENEYIRNATDYPDMQELLYSCDVMISDYSSCVWDYSFTGRPCFLFCNDFEENGGNESFEIPLQEWGFPFCQSMDELLESIASFDPESYRKSVKAHHKQMGSYEDGKATERACRIIESCTRK